MKPRHSLFLSAGLNLVLAAAFVALWLSAPPSEVVPSLAPAAPENPVAAIRACPVPESAPDVTNSLFDWSRLESDDYRKYIANLRAVDCPEETIRDIIVADLDQLYASKNKSAPFEAPPWRNADQRRTGELVRTERQSALRAEKRALVKELIGYEWDNHANELWHEDFMTGLVLGFLPDNKAPQLMSIVGKYLDLAAGVKERANGILIDEDHAQLRKLHADLLAEASQLLTPEELEEIQLRVQAGTFLPTANIHWDNVAISGAGLRDFVRLSKTFKDTFQFEYLDPNRLSGHEQAEQEEAFARQLEKFFGPKRFADFQRAQDRRFQEVFEFAQDRQVSPATAIKVYDARRVAENQAGQVRHDHSLSAQEQAAALAVVKTMAVGTVSSALGDAYREYPDGPAGSWLQDLSPPTETQDQSQAP